MENEVLRNLSNEIGITVASILTGVGSLILYSVGRYVRKGIIKESTRKDIAKIEHEAMLYALQNIEDKGFKEKFNLLYETKYNKLVEEYKIEISKIKKLLN